MEVKFQLSASPLIAVMLALVGTTAATSVMFIIAVPVPVRIVAALGVVALFLAAIYRHALLRGPRAVRTVAFLDDDSLAITANNGVWRGTLIHLRAAPLLTVFIVGDGRRFFNVLVAADSMSHDRHRQLRVRLLGAKKSPTPQPAAPSSPPPPRRSSHSSWRR